MNSANPTDHAGGSQYPIPPKHAKIPLNDRVEALEKERDHLRADLNDLQERFNHLNERFNMFLEMNNLWDGS